MQILYSSLLGGAAETTGPVNLEQFAGLTGKNSLAVADVGIDVALDPTNKAYITGIEYSGAGSFPLKADLQGTQTDAPGENPVGFIAKFDTTQSGAASLIYTTYIGGSGDASSVNSGDGDLPFGIAVDASGEPFIVGQTYSTNFPDTSTCGSFGKTKDGGAAVNSGFVAKLNAAATDIVYARYINGTNNATESRVAWFSAGCDSSTMPHTRRVYTDTLVTAADHPLPKKASSSPYTSKCIRRVANGGKDRQLSSVIASNGTGIRRFSWASVVHAC